MNVRMEELIEKVERKNKKYVFPGNSERGYAQMISALANSEGGELILGVYDDGNRLHAKGYEFPIPKKEKISEILDGYDNFIIEEMFYKDKCFVSIQVNKENKGVSYENDYYIFSNEINDEMNKIQAVKLFISYNHKISELADIVEKEFEKKFGPSLQISRDTHLDYRDNIEEFMKSIKKNDIVLSLISNSYMESEACMYEITELMKDDEYREKLAYIVLSEEDKELFSKTKIDLNDLVPKIYGSERFEYLEFWVNKKNEYISRIERLKDNYEVTSELSETIKRVSVISQGVGPFVEHLNASKGLDFTAMKENDFIDIYSIIKKKLKEINNKN